MKKYVVNENTTLRSFTDNVCPQASFAFRTLLKTREIRVNGKKVGEDVSLSAGDEVCYFLTPQQERKRAYTVIYEDENVIVVDKESGVNSEAVFSDLSERGETHFIHRLDRNTEGIIVFAKNVGAADELLSCFRKRQAEKIYHALVFGRPKAHAVEEAYLKKDKDAALVRISRTKGERITTEYSLLEPRGDCSLLKVLLHTGKTHQIRAHLAFLGYPVVGDEKYGDSKKNREKGVTRQKLLSKELTLNCGGVLAYLNGKTFCSEKNL